MRIGEKSGIDRPAAASRVGSMAQTRSHGVPASKGDSVALSDAARALARLIGTVADGSLDPVRAAQVAILRNAVAAGRYEPDLREVARKLLTEVAAEFRG